MRCTGGRWGHGEDGGRKAARGQVTEAASVEEAEAWCVVAGDDVGEPGVISLCRKIALLDLPRRRHPQTLASCRIHSTRTS